jgi:general secretion pathway protein K
MSTNSFRQRGSALLAVLWLAAGLAAIALALSNTVRGETERASTQSDGLRAYYLASGAIQRAALELLWSSNDPESHRISSAPVLMLDFPTGVARVEIIPETAKLDINTLMPEFLSRLLTAIGLERARAEATAEAIVEYRGGGGAAGGLADFYAARGPSFRPRHASLEETEELMAVRGVTPELYYGTYIPVAKPEKGQPRLVGRSGLADCVSVFGSRGGVDINTARPEVLYAIGVPMDLVGMIVQRRRLAPFTPDSVMELVRNMPVLAGRVWVGGNSIYTLRATAQLRLPNGQLSDVKRTVSALIKYMPQGYDAPIHYLRWYDTAWSD